MLRRALYEAANVLLGRVKRPCALRDWGKALAETKRARVAVARMLAVLLHRLWLSGNRLPLGLDPPLRNQDRRPRKGAIPLYVSRLKTALGT